MKKIFTLTIGMLFAVVLMAADRRPEITVENFSRNNFKIVIDGRSYFGDYIRIPVTHFNGNRHTIKVYEMRRGFFGKQEKLVDAKNFFIAGRDVEIKIDRFGNIRIDEVRKNRYDDNDRRDWNDRDNHSRDNDDGYYKREERNRF